MKYHNSFGAFKLHRRCGREENMRKVFVIAGATVDKIICLDKLPEPVPGTVFSKDSYDTIGSTGCGKAISLRKLGFDTTFHAMIGADSSGDLIRKKMEGLGIRFLYDIDPKGTEEHVNLMDDHGGRISIFTRYATFEPELRTDKFDEYITESDYIVLNIINYSRRLITESFIRTCVKLLSKTNMESTSDNHRYLYQE
jgi:sugar/nucleoside kinase (ribokinase family)